MSKENPANQQLKRELGWFGATTMGLASIIGVGIFVSVGIAAGNSGVAVIAALFIAGLLSICNSLNFAQLAANHPVSGGLYEYGYRYLNPWLGFTGGWMYLLGKIAVAATAALGFAGYLINILGLSETTPIVPIAETAVIILTLVVLGGMKRSKRVTTIILSITISSLLFLVIAGGALLPAKGFQYLSFSQINTDSFLFNFLQSIALLFAAYNGAGRIATLGEEVTEPRKNIPRAIILTLGIVVTLYIAVAVVSVGSIGAEGLASATVVQAAPLEVVAESFGIPGAATVLAIGATAAMLSVLLSIILSLSRVFLAMGRRGDMPGFLAQLKGEQTQPYGAIILSGTVVALLVLTGDVATTWSFGAFGGLYRCVIGSMAALQLKDDERLYPRWSTWLALLSCVFLAFCIDWQIWIIGFALIGFGILWHTGIQQLNLVESSKSEVATQKPKVTS
ncbi:MAG: APC family permease [Prochloraceae cyanobacterium]|nr:APC family permease [Prochloraceae cyanobacterium]